MGTEWLLVSQDGHGPLPGPRPTLEIEEENLGGATECNGFGGAIDRLMLDDMAVTKRKCAPRAAAENEERFLGIVRDVGYYPVVFANGRMNLETEDGRKLVFSASEQSVR